MVIFTLYFDVENVPKWSKTVYWEQYHDNNTLTHKEWVEAGTYTHIYAYHILH